MTEPDDRDLRELFAQLREEDASEAPPFAPMWARARQQRDAARSHRRWWLAPVPVAAAASLVLAVVLLSRPAVAPPEVLMDAEVTVADWTSVSTDFLALGEASFLELADAGALEAFDDETWTLPSDDLLQQADQTFGQEPRM